MRALLTLHHEGRYNVELDTLKEHPLSRHEALPVARGVKYGANKWVCHERSLPCAMDVVLPDVRSLIHLQIHFYNFYDNHLRGLTG
jgi:hypothetical protein